MITLEPKGDYTDVGQAYILAREYSNILRHSKSTGFIVYNGNFWEDSDSKAQNLALQLTNRQFQEAISELQNAKSEMDANGALDILIKTGVKKAPSSLNQQQIASFDKYTHAQEYKKFIDKRRAYSSVDATLNVVKSMLEINPDELDKNGFLLNTPSYTYDLKLGLQGCRNHSYSDFITKQTAVNPSELFNAYCNYCRATGEVQRSVADFYSRLKTVKCIERKEAHHQVKLRGIKIKEQ